MEFEKFASRLIASENIDLALDVGANSGQFAKLLRTAYGYTGSLISFEPLDDAYALLLEAANTDPLWECIHTALGECKGASVINVSANSWSSSLLDVMPSRLIAEPSIGYVKQQDVAISRLDDLVEQFSPFSKSLFLKLDVQGYETRVLQGALKIMDRVKILQVETSLVPVYAGETLIGDMVRTLDFLGFRIVAVDPGWSDPRTGELLQMDLLMVRK